MNKNNKKTLSDSIDEKQQAFYMDLAKQYLQHFGNSNPSIKQLCEFQALLCQAWVPRFISLDSRLNQQEATTLYLSARGETTKQIARFCNVGPRQVERYRAAIFKKLAYRNIAEAVMKGLQFLEIKVPLEFEEEKQNENSR